MGTVSKGLNKRTDKEELSDLVTGYLKKGASTNLITWVILGGMKFIGEGTVRHPGLYTNKKTALALLKLLVRRN